MDKDKEYYETAGNSFKLIGILCIIIAFIFYLLGFSIEEIDYVDLFLTGSFIFVCGKLMIE